MAVFYSFHYDRDNWRVQQVRNIGSIDQSGSIAAQDWEKVRYGTESRIREWIDTQMRYKSAVIVLIGSQTSKRDWVQYEIQRAWEIKKPLLGIRIHGLRDRDSRVSVAGSDPFLNIEGFIGRNPGLPVFDPTKTDVYGRIDSKATYQALADNLESWSKSGLIRK